MTNEDVKQIHPEDKKKLMHIYRMFMLGERHFKAWEDFSEAEKPEVSRKLGILRELYPDHGLVGPAKRHENVFLVVIPSEDSSLTMISYRIEKDTPDYLGTIYIDRDNAVTPYAAQDGKDVDSLPKRFN